MIRRAVRMAALAFVVPIATPVPGIAQLVQEVPDEISCPSCSIEVTELLRLGSLDDDVALSRISNLAVDPGRFVYASRTYQPGTIARYRWDGSLEATFGRQGRGPGEFSGSQLDHVLRVDADGFLHVVEADRHTVLSPGLAGVVRTHPVPASFRDAVPLAGGELVVSINPPALTGLPSPPIVLLDSLGAVIRSFGAQRGETARVSVDPADPGRVWVSYRDEYRLEEYELPGLLRRVLVRRAEWFPARPAQRPPPAAFSQPRLLDVYQDPDGNVWTLTRVAAADRERAEAVLERGEVRLDSMDRDAVHDTRLEVLDPVSASLLASEVFDEAYRLVDGGYLVRFEETDEGLVRAVLSSVTLRILPLKDAR